MLTIFLDILFNVRTIAGLEQDQPVRKYQDPEGYNQLQLNRSEKVNHQQKYIFFIADTHSSLSGLGFRPG